MDIIGIIQSNLLTPLILFFLIGLVAVRLKSDLRIPEVIITIISIYLLAAIGLHGGIEMRKAGLENMIIPMSVAIVSAVLLTLNHYQILRRFGKFNIFDASAMAATYGSVSVATFSVALAFLRNQGIEHEGYMAAILAVLEPTGIIVGILLANMGLAKLSKKQVQDHGIKDKDYKEHLTMAITDKIESNNVKISGILRETLTGKAIFVLLSTIIVGYLVGESGFKSIKIVYEDAFIGVLTIYLLEMGIIAGQRLDLVKKSGPFLLAFGILIPIFNGVVGVFIATLIGVSLGGSFLLGILFASASYIAAPAILRTAIPKANPSLYLTSALGITFPYNVIANVPTLFIFSTFLHNGFSIEGII